MAHGFSLLLIMLSCVAVVASSDRAAAEEPDQVRATAAATLQAALDHASKHTDPMQKVAALSQALATAHRQVPQNVLIAEMIDKLGRAAGEPRLVAAQWQAACAEANELLRFEVLVESPTPDGFPLPTPVGEIRLQRYPAYRLAKTEMTFIEGRAFWTLFSHIKDQKIAMTAPVELTYRSDDAAKKTSMAFLYRNLQQGSAGKDGNVDVIDIPAQTVLSIGVRGDATTSRVADAKRRLEHWLGQPGQGWEANGPLRVFAYNSPFVSDAKKFSEVQIPLQKKAR
ncbi:MAG: heme-binding protein [Planctomycetaceae bacterium]|nr:heme-binding protein [Planctomycetaceae bacterium]